MSTQLGAKGTWAPTPAVAQTLLDSKFPGRKNLAGVVQVFTRATFPLVLSDPDPIHC